MRHMTTNKICPLMDVECSGKRCGKYLECMDKQIRAAANLNLNYQELLAQVKKDFPELGW